MFYYLGSILLICKHIVTRQWEICLVNVYCEVTNLSNEVNNLDPKLDPS